MEDLSIEIEYNLTKEHDEFLKLVASTMSIATSKELTSNDILCGLIILLEKRFGGPINSKRSDEKTTGLEATVKPDVAADVLGGLMGGSVGGGGGPRPLSNDPMDRI